jgi:hypothetical protein
VANPRPKKEFLLPTLRSNVSDFLIFLMISVCFRQYVAQKVDNFVQPWETQIGLRANFLLKSHIEGQIIDFFYRFVDFSMN